MYNLVQFLYKANIHLDSLLGEDIIQSIFQIFNEKNEHYDVDYDDDKLIQCRECDGGRNESSNMVHLHMLDDLVTESSGSEVIDLNKNVISGRCEWCSSLHFRCAKCNCINSITEFTDIECEGGCGLNYSLKNVTDRGGVEEQVLHLL